jgi:hypothetical protein
MLKRKGIARIPHLRKDGQTDMNKNTTKTPLASYSIWYRLCLVIMGLIAAVNAVALVGWITGDTLSIFYGIDGLLLDTAMQNNYLILYMNYFGIIACAIMILLAGYYIYESIGDKEFTFDRLRNYMIFTALSIWGVPLYHAIADLAMTAGKVRSILSFDLFDLGMNGWPMVACTGLVILVLVLNTIFGDVPANAEIE